MTDFPTFPSGDFETSTIVEGFHGDVSHDVSHVVWRRPDGTCGATIANVLSQVISRAQRLNEDGQPTRSRAMSIVVTKLEEAYALLDYYGLDKA